MPLWIKISYTLLVCILVPIYWRQYGPGNFLWFSDLALFITAAALWLESSLLASMMAVSVIVLESVWIIDFLIGLVAGGSLAFHAVAAIRPYLFEVEPFDPLTFAVVGAFIFITGCAAIVPPVFRAMRVNPMEVLRAE